MNRLRNFSQFIKKGILYTILWGLLFLVVSGAIITSLLQIPQVQTWTVKKIANHISEILEFKIEIDKVNIRWFDTYELRGIRIIDTADSLMIGVNQLVVDVDLVSIYSGRNKIIDEVWIDDTEVNIYRNVSGGYFNITDFAEKVKKLQRKQTPSIGPRSIISIDKVNLNQGKFVFHDQEADSIHLGFDYYHFQVDSIFSEVYDLIIIADTVEMDIAWLTGFEPKFELPLEIINTFYRVSDEKMEFYGLDAFLRNSRIKDTVVLEYSTINNLSYFIDSVYINGNTTNSLIHSKDLALFAPYLDQFDDYYTLSGRFRGRVNRFSVRELQLQFGRSSQISGKASFIGLPDIMETFIDAELSNSLLDANDLLPYTGTQSLVDVKKFGRARVNAKFLGFPTDFVADGAFETGLGQIISDINLKLEEDSKLSTYSGSLTTIDFDLGALSNQEETFQKISLNGSINGQGFKLEDANFSLVAEVSKVGINNYNFENIKTDARLAKEFFEGKLEINDPNFIFNADATLDLRNNRNKVKVDARVDTLNFHLLNYSKVPFGISGEFNLDFVGLEIDSILGEGSFKDATINYDNRSIFFDSLKIVSFKDEARNRRLYFTSEYFDLSAIGSFTPTQTIKDLTKIYEEFRLEYFNDEKKITEYYASLKSDDKKSRMQYDFGITGELKDFNPIIDLFTDKVHVSKNIKVNSRFFADFNSIISFNTFIDTISINDNTFENLVLNLDANKILNERQILAMAYLNSEKLKLKSGLNTEDVFLEGIWSGKHIDLFSKIKQMESANHIELSAELDIKPGLFDFHVIETDISLLEKKWDLDSRNQIEWDGKDLIVDFWKLSNDNQELLLSGEISKNPAKELFLTIRDVSLDIFNPLLNYELSGIVNGFIGLKDYFQTFQVESELDIKDLTLNDFLVGNISGFSHLLPDENSIQIDYEVVRKGQNTLTLTGFYHTEKEEALEMKANLNDANLNILEPFLDYVLTEIGGTATGEISITGNTSSPILSGIGLIKNGKGRIGYLNTLYSFEGNMVFEANEIGFDNVKVIDDQNNVGYINGGFFHDGFKDFVIDLSGSMNNVKVLSTTAQDNELFYGTAIVDGTFNIIGPVNNLNIKANAVSKRGTKIFIPLSLESGIEQEEYITFKSLDTLLNKIDLSEKLNLSGIKMDFDFEITPDAYCEIIFDLKAGDIIRGRGNGKMKMLIDTNGDFNMFGDYVFTDGGYNFTLYNFINKEFQIQPESKISWFGNPYEALMNITATYEQMALLGPILIEADTSILTSPALRRRYPAKVFLKLDGPMLMPDIAFNINVSGYPDNVTSPVSQNSYSVQAGVEAFKNRLITDEQYLKKQVFSLIILRRFSPDNTFNVGAQSVGSSVSEFISNQVSYWIAQVDENLEIDVDLAGLSDDQFQTFQLRLAYTFLDGRLRISRDGAVAGAQQVDNELAALAGDWTVEYLLTNDGKYRVKMYNRTNYNTINAGFDVQQTAGFSFLQTQSFDNVKELFVDARNRNRKKSQEANKKSEQNGESPEVKKNKDVRKEDEEILVGGNKDIPY